MVFPVEPPESFCSYLSAQAGESLHATASVGEIWFLLEYSGLWENKAFEQSQLPEAVKAHLAGAVEALPESRVLMIKSRREVRDPAIQFYVVNSCGNEPFYIDFRLESYTGLLSIDLIAAARGEAYADQRGSEPLFLVCTNGKRDACCAKFGLPVYDLLEGKAGVKVWQSSHVGGHRFAPNLVIFPWALYFGRVPPQQALALVEGYRQGKLLLDFYRGRACYPPVVQAAEIYLRQHSHLIGVDELRLLRYEETACSCWDVYFSAPKSGQTYRLCMGEEQTGEQVRTGCFTRKTEPVMRYPVFQMEAISA